MAETRDKKGVVGARALGDQRGAGGGGAGKIMVFGSLFFRRPLKRRRKTKKKKNRKNGSNRGHLQCPVLNYRACVRSQLNNGV